MRRLLRIIPECISQISTAARFTQRTTIAKVLAEVASGPVEYFSPSVVYCTNCDLKVDANKSILIKMATPQSTQVTDLCTKYA